MRKYAVVSEAKRKGTNTIWQDSEPCGGQDSLILPTSAHLQYTAVAISSAGWKRLASCSPSGGAVWEDMVQRGCLDQKIVQRWKGPSKKEEVRRGKKGKSGPYR